MCDSIQTRILALMHWDPDAVLLGSAAAWVSFWPETGVEHHVQPQASSPASAGLRVQPPADPG